MMTYSVAPGPAGPADGLSQQRRERPKERMSRSRPVRIAQYSACLNQPDSSRYPPDTRVHPLELNAGDSLYPGNWNLREAALVATSRGVGSPEAKRAAWN